MPQPPFQQPSDHEPTDLGVAADASRADAGASHLDRRTLLRTVGLVGLGSVLAGCASNGESAPTTAGTPDAPADGATTATTTPAATATSVPTTTTDTVAETTAEASDAAAGSADGWAVGGTDLITVEHPGDDVFTGAGVCPVALSTGLTEGPCYYAEDTGEDISAGLTGLPMQLCLRLIDADCEPVADHLVEVWHCDADGLYSGDTSVSGDAARFRGDFCTSGDAEAESSTYYRGQLVSDASGRVNFTSCFPGWYATRTLHVHVSVSDPAGERQIVSQLCFSDELVTDIPTNHESYTHRGDQDTPLASGRDAFFPSADVEQFVMTTVRNPDGTLLAYHSIQLT